MNQKNLVKSLEISWIVKSQLEVTEDTNHIQNIEGAGNDEKQGIRPNYEHIDDEHSIEL